jgi:hypothetical protein
MKNSSPKFCIQFKNKKMALMNWFYMDFGCNKMIRNVIKEGQSSI